VFELGWSSKKGEGMGFGLFWTRDYIEGLGGSIEVESTYKSGTTFSLTLPLGSK
jgi:sensor histidine kinase regulating citrate/malate metabolism